MEETVFQPVIVVRIRWTLPRVFPCIIPEVKFRPGVILQITIWSQR